MQEKCSNIRENKEQKKLHISTLFTEQSGFPLICVIVIVSDLFSY